MSTAGELEVIVFSKDRAFQLEALLRSMDEHVRYATLVHVVYTASSERFADGYGELQHLYPTVDWVEETDFAADVKRLLRGANSPRIMFLVDDIVFIREVDDTELLELLDTDSGVLTVSLRLGENVTHCYMQNAASAPPDLSSDSRWEWASRSGDWGYPMSLDGNVYRRDDLAPYVAQLDFHNPNTFEAQMAGSPLTRPLMACSRLPRLVNLAMNRVQDTYASNRSGQVSIDWLNERFLAGDGLDIAHVEQQRFDTCHVEHKPRFMARSSQLNGRAVSVDVTTETTIRRPVDVVAAFSGDWTNAPAWYTNISSIEWKTASPMDVGSQATFVAHFFGRELSYTYEIVELVRDERLVMRTAEGPFPMETSYVWQATRDGHTRMTLRNRGTPSGFSRLAAPFMAWAMRRANKNDLCALKQLLEA